jgi:hypothetical protein
LHVNSGTDGISAGIAGSTYGIRFDNGGTFSSGKSTIHGVDDTLTSTYQPLMLNASTLTFGINANEKMRLDSSGTLIIKNDSSTTYGPTLQFDSQPKATWDVGDVVGEIDFFTSDTSGNAPYSAGFIKVLNETGAGTLPSGGLSFGTATYNASGGAIERARLDSSGRLGLGVTSPYKKLEVAGDIQLDATDANMWIKSGASGTNGFINWTFNSDDTVFGKIGIDYDTRSSTGFHIDSGYPITIDATTNIDFALGGSNQGRWNSTGLGLGIGTTSPLYTLDVNGDVQINETLIAKAGADLILQARASQVVGINSGGSRAMTLDDSQNVGIGTTSPTSRLRVKSTGSTEEQITIESSGNTNTLVAIGQSDNGNSSGAIELNNTNGAIGTHLDGHGASYFNNGNVGIGTTSPNTKLDVNSGISSSSANVISISQNTTGAIKQAVAFGVAIQNGGEATNASDLFISTASGGSLSERARITSDGFFGIGTTSIPNPFSGAYSNILQVGTDSGNTRFAITGGSSSSCDLAFADSNNASVSDSYAGSISYKHATDDMRFATATSERLRITSDGSLQAQANNGFPLQLTSVVSGGSELRMRQSRGTIASPTNSSANGDGNYLTSASAGTVSERMRITSSGEILKGITSAVGVGGTPADANSTEIGNGYIILARDDTATAKQISFGKNGSEVGSIETTGSATSYNTSSDYRLKEDLKDFNALEIASKIKMYDFKWKADDSRSYGVMAHELEEVLQQLVVKKMLKKCNQLIIVS